MHRRAGGSNAFCTICGQEEGTLKVCGHDQLKKQLEAVTRERDNLRMVAQRTATHCESLTRQLQEAKEEIFSIASERIASRSKEESSPLGRASIQFDSDPTSLMPATEAVNMELLLMRQNLASEIKLKEQALSELQVARDLAAKAMQFVEKVTSSSPHSLSPLPKTTSPRRSSLVDLPKTGSPSPPRIGSPAGDQAVMSVFKGWAQMCSSVLSKGATWLHSAKETENEIEKILKGYYNPVSPTKGKRPEKPKASDLLDSVSRVIDGWKKQLRRQEDELQSLIAMLQKWKTTSERAALAGEASSSPATGVS